MTAIYVESEIIINRWQGCPAYVRFWQGGEFPVEHCTLPEGHTGEHQLESGRGIHVKWAGASKEAE